MQHVTLYTVGKDPVVDYAAGELAKYLRRISGAEVAREAADAFVPGKTGIWLGTDEHFPNSLGAGPAQGTGHGTQTRGTQPGPERPGDAQSGRHPLDDAVRIKSVSPGQLVITGPNPRSVLFSVYAYLESLGCRWVRMGQDGEVLPESAAIRLDGYDVDETPSYRYRGICIEGGVSIEHATQIVDYMAKKRFNTYFIQFQNAYIFWSRWYDRKSETHQLAIEDADRYTVVLAQEVKKRGLSLQAVGHGWTCESLGVRGLGWIKTNEELPPEKRVLLAQVNGVRDWWRGVPIDTELCLSNPVAFETLVSYIVEYARSHQEVDILHLWMSDGWNNRCECEGCTAKRPSDWYVDVLNEVDARLTKENIATRIVFLVYADLLWAPTKERIRNPERFIIMFAPLTRLYRNALNEQPRTDEQPTPYTVNKNQFPKSTAVNVAYLRDWQKMFRGDGFIFDYHFLWKHSILEPTGLYIAKIHAKDIAAIEELDLHGMVNCQVQRYFFPTGFAMETSARMLWNKAADFEALKREYFGAAFGEFGPGVLGLLERLSALFDSDAVFGLEPVPSAEYHRRLQEASPVLDELKALIARAAAHAGLSPAVKASFRYLELAAQFMSIFHEGLVAFAGEGDRAALAQSYERAGEFLVANEEELHEVCDCAMWRQWMNGYAAQLRKEAAAQPA